MKPVKLIILVMANTPAIPDNFAMTKEYGNEVIVLNNNTTVEGISTYVEFHSREMFEIWMKEAEGIWVTQNPMAGKWDFFMAEDVKHG